MGYGARFRNSVRVLYGASEWSIDFFPKTSRYMRLGCVLFKQHHERAVTKARMITEEKTPILCTSAANRRLKTCDPYDISTHCLELTNELYIFLFKALTSTSPGKICSYTAYT